MRSQQFMVNIFVSIGGHDFIQNAEKFAKNLSINCITNWNHKLWCAFALNSFICNEHYVRIRCVRLKPYSCDHMSMMLCYEMQIRIAHQYNTAQNTGKNRSHWWTAQVWLCNRISKMHLQELKSECRVLATCADAGTRHSLSGFFFIYFGRQWMAENRKTTQTLHWRDDYDDEMHANWIG